VVLWEMATLAEQPYQGMANEEVLYYVIGGGIMDKPERCPNRLYVVVYIVRLCFRIKILVEPNYLGDKLYQFQLCCGLQGNELMHLPT